MEYGNITIGKTDFVGEYISEKSSLVRPSDDVSRLAQKVML
jgi:hypothetical protein